MRSLWKEILECELAAQKSEKLFQDSKLAENYEDKKTQIHEAGYSTLSKLIVDDNLGGNQLSNQRQLSQREQTKKTGSQNFLKNQAQFSENFEIQEEKIEKEENMESNQATKKKKIRKDVQRDWRCPDCKYNRYKSKQGLKEHIKKVHPSSHDEIVSLIIPPPWAHSRRGRPSKLNVKQKQKALEQEKQMNQLFFL